jgi:hypothetical protein
VALDVIGKAIARMPAKKYIENYLRILSETKSSKRVKAASKPAAKKKTTKR